MVESLKLGPDHQPEYILPLLEYVFAQDPIGQMEGPGPEMPQPGSSSARPALQVGWA